MKGSLKAYKKIAASIIVLALVSGLFPVGTFAETTSEKIKKAEELKKQTEAQKDAVSEKKEELEGERAVLYQEGDFEFTVPMGDEHEIKHSNETVDCSRLGFFDEMEESCWDLFKSYCEHRHRCEEIRKSMEKS